MNLVCSPNQLLCVGRMALNNFKMKRGLCLPWKIYSDIISPPNTVIIPFPGKEKASAATSESRFLVGGSKFG